MARSHASPSSLPRFASLAFLLGLALVGCRQAFNPLDPSSPGFVGDDGVGGQLQSQTLPSVERWESVLEHGDSEFIGLEIGDATYGQSGYFVEPRSTANGRDLYVALEFASPVLPADFDGILVVGSSFSAAGAQYGALEPEWFDASRNQVAFRIGVVNEPTSIRIRLVGAGGVVISQREYSILPGDVNGDLVVDSNDVIAATLAGQVSADSAAAAIRADLNADGTVEPTGGDSAVRDANIGSLIAGPAPPFVDDPPPPPPLTFTLTYDPNGADSGSVPSGPTSYIAGTTATILGNTNSLSKSGASFVGWNTEADGTGTGYNPGESLALTGNITLYADWGTLPTYTVDYEPNEADGGTPPATSNYVEAETVTVEGNVGSLFRTGFRFVGWNTTANGTGTAYAPGSVFPMPPEDVTLFAQWEEVFSITYDGNGADSGTVPVDSAGYAPGEDAVVAGNPGGLSLSGFTFIGWNTEPSGGPATRYVGGSIYTMGSADVVLYAEWSSLPTYTVTYDANGATGGSVPPASNYLEGATVTVVDNTGGLALTGHEFDGWNTEATGSGTAYAPSDAFTMPPEDVTLYAQWVPVYTINYLANGATGGTVPLDSNSYRAGEPVTIASNPGGLEKIGHTLEGWNDTSDGSGTRYSLGQAITMPSANLTLFAEWSVNEYTLSFDGNAADGGDVPAAPALYFYNSSLSIPDNTGGLYRTGFTFGGWNTAADGSGAQYNPADTFVVPASDTTLYARWIPVGYDLVYAHNGATGGLPPMTTQYVAGETVTVDGAGTLVKDGYAFQGWNTQADGLGTSYAPGATFTMPAADVTLYAIWNAIPTYTITYDANGATGGSAPSPESHPSGAAITLDANTGSLSLPNFVLHGWNTAADGSGLSYALGASYTMPANNVTLYAEWRLGVSGGGLGIPGAPYYLLTADDLNMVRHDLDAVYEVAADIDLNVSPYNTGTGWVPIGNGSAEFTGTFDGGYPAYTISNLFINDPSISGNDGAGLFGKTLNAELRNVALENVNVTADDTVGGLVGWPAGGTIQRSYTTGTVRGDNWVGGLSGWADNNTAIDQSFSTADVEGSSQVGGLVGSLVSGVVSDSFAYGYVNGGSGLVGGNDGSIDRSFSSGLSTDAGFAGYGSGVGSVNQSFFDADRAGQSDSSGATALTTPEAVQEASFPGFDFGSVWTIVEGISYPYLQWYAGPAPAPAFQILYDANGGVNPPPASANMPQGDPVTLATAGGMTNGSLSLIEWNEASDGSGVGYSPGDTIPMPAGGLRLYAIWAPVFAGGDGTVGAPYQIATADQLSNIRYGLNAHYELISDIDLNVAPYNTGGGWEPIGWPSDTFQGSLSGNGHVISGLYINRSTSFTGLFSRIANGSVSEVVIADADVTGVGSLGILAGQVRDGDARIFRVGVVRGTVATSDPTGQYNIGGLVGYVSDTTVANDTIVESFAQVTVTGGASVGGLVGFLAYGTIRNSYAIGTVTGEAVPNNTNGNIGGLVGRVSSAEITQSYAAVQVNSSAPEIGGFSGTATISGGENHYDEAVSTLTGSTAVYLAQSTAAMTTQATFAGWDFATVWAVPGPNYPYLQWQGGADIPMP